MDRVSPTDENPLKLLEKYFSHLKSDLEYISTDYKERQNQDNRQHALDSHEELTQAKHELRGAHENIQELRSRFTEAAEESNHWR